MQEQNYTDTSGKLAREAGLTVPTVALYADAGWLDFIRCSNGTRLFRSGQAPLVRKIYAERMANRGRKAGVRSARQAVVA
jgi:DNA-binding transcriptional MerR regulator